MKKSLTRGEKWLFASPLLFLFVGIVAWQWRKSVPYSVELPVSSSIRGLEFSSDSRRLVVFSQNYETRIYAGQVIDVQERGRVCDLTLPTAPQGQYFINSSGWSGDGKSIVGDLGDHTGSVTHSRIVIWDSGSGVEKMSYARGTSFSPLGAVVHFSADSKSLVGFGVPPAIYDVANGRRLNQPDKRFSQEPYDSQSSENLKFVAMRLADNKFQIADAKTNRVIWKPLIDQMGFFEWRGDILCLEKCPYTEPPTPNALLLWDGKTRRQLPSPPIAPISEVGTSSLSPDGKTLAYTTWTSAYNENGKSKKDRNEMIVWDYRANREVWRTNVPDSYTGLHWSPNGQRLMEVDIPDEDLFPLEPRQLKVYDRSGNLLFKRSSVGLFNAWSPDSQQVAISIEEPDEKLFHPTKNIEIHRIED